MVCGVLIEASFQSLSSFGGSDSNLSHGAFSCRSFGDYGVTERRFNATQTRYQVLADRRRQTEPTANVLILFEKATAASGNGGRRRSLRRTCGRSVRQAVGLCQCLDVGVDVSEAGGRYSLVDASIVVQAAHSDVVHGRGGLKTTIGDPLNLSIGKIS